MAEGTLTDNSPASQITAALALIQMKVAPVITVHIPFGGDNHSDPLLATEAAQTVAGVATILKMTQQLEAAGLQDQVSFLAMNVFGRTMNVAHKGTSGRDHHEDHHCSVIIGALFKGSVIAGGTGGGGGATCTDTWSGYAAGWFSNRCASCHGTTEFGTLTAVSNNQFAIRSRIGTGNMPPGGGASDKARILSWFTCGLKP